MPTITIPDATFDRLARRAEALGTTVEALAAPALAQLTAGPPTPPVDLPYDEWKRLVDEYLAEVKARAHLYPPGFEADVSRESIYEGCGE